MTIMYKKITANKIKSLYSTILFLVVIYYQNISFTIFRACIEIQN